MSSFQPTKVTKHHTNDGTEENHDGPESKRLKTTVSMSASTSTTTDALLVSKSNGNRTTTKQMKLGSFFSKTTSSSPTKISSTTSVDTAMAVVASPPLPATAASSTKVDNVEEEKNVTTIKGAPLVPTLIRPDQLRHRVRWESHFDQHVIVRKLLSDKRSNQSSSSDGIKIAAFDVDGTLVNWTIGNGMWPSRLEHYELWSSTSVIDKLRSLYDKDGYHLLLVSNQGGIQKAHTGKKATTFKSMVDWIAHVVDRPIQAVVSTRTMKKCPTTSYHKPTPKLWNVAKQLLFSNAIAGAGGNIDLSKSFFVGDSADPDDDQGGVDMKFAQNVGIKFYKPDEYFGPSDQERRQQGLLSSGGGGGSSAGDVPVDAIPPPIRALRARAALMGGYYQGPVLLILCGVQGSGKSTFSQRIMGTNTTSSSTNDEESYGERPWIHLSQDTINNGKPGKREKVEKEASLALQRGQSVIIDRMHLTPDQRKYFYAVARECNVPAHVVLLNPPKDIVTKRVRARTNHPGKVEGSEGVKRTLQSLSTLVVPTYDEYDDKENNKEKDNDELVVPQLISCTSTSAGAARIADLYRNVVPGTSQKDHTATNIDVQVDEDHRIVLLEGQENTHIKAVKMPMITMGTMGLGKRIARDVIKMSYELGYRGIDTAPTYKNEDRVGEGLQDIEKVNKSGSMFCIVKVPKRATQPDQVRTELSTSLKNLQSSGNGCDLLLLHWPCDVIQGGTLSEVWQAMEQCYKRGLCKALGVCNFNVAALSQLLACCTVRPVVNQVERHPLLPQWDLIDYCARKDIIIQAHTPLGQGKADLLQNPIVTEVAEETKLTPCQVVLQWNIQQGIPVVPKFSTRDHGQELYQLLTSNHKLSPMVMSKLNALGEQKEKNKRFVVAPFMYGNAPYCWGERMPTNK